MERIQTHMAGLDEMLDGGVPKGHIVLLVGAPGTMKTSLAYGTLWQNARRGTKGLYISLEQSRASLVDQMVGMRMPPDDAKDNLSILDLGALRKKMGDASREAWLDLFKMYAASVRKGFPYDVLVLDSLNALETLAHMPASRLAVFDLFNWLRGLQCTSLILMEMPREHLLAMAGLDPLEIYGRRREDYLADGILYIKMEKRGEFEVQRRMRCVKMRSANHRTGYHALLFDEGAFRVTRIMS